MKFKRFAAAVAAVLCCTSTLAFFPETVQRVTAAEAVGNNFEVSYEGWYANGADSELQAVEGMGVGGSRAMVVSGRKSAQDGAQSSKGFYLSGGVAYTYNVQVMSIADQTFHLSVLTKDLDTDEVTEQEIAVRNVKGGEWTNISAVYTAPENSYEFQLTLTTDSTDNFAFDEVHITSDQPVDTVSAAANETGLKDVYANYFRVGNILNGGTVQNSTITATFLKDYNAIECENETKPDATLVQNGSTDTNIKVSLNSCAAIADFASRNGLAFRGHTLVWHSQTPSWFFHENFNANAGWVSKNVMDQRLESYIKNMFNAFKTQYPDLNLYAYDVCNECVSDDGNRTANFGGAREAGDSKIKGQEGKSAWVQVYGDNSFVEKAFTYARKYAPSSCKLYYNDYNEYWDHKRDCIYNMCKSLYQKGLLDGVGMQSHINADRNGFSGTSAYVAAMKKYLSIGCDVQISELDISIEGGKYSATDQANKYKDIFQAAVDWNKNPQSDGRVTLVQIWGPNDANTWIKTENAPLLYNTNNQPKAAYNTLMQLIPQSDWGDYKNPANGGGEVKTPEPNEYNWWFNYGFESGVDGFVSRGATTLESSSKNAYVGSKSLYVSGRTATWNGANFTLPSRIFEAGKEYSFSAHVMYDEGLNETEDMYFSIQYTGTDGKPHYDKIDTGTAVKGQWMQLSNKNYKIPEGASDVVIYFETPDTTTSFYVDEVIAAVAGTGVQGEGKPKVSKQTYLKGDVDGDGVMDIYDLGLSKKGLVKGFDNKVAERCADIDENGTVEISDIVQMSKFLLGKITTFEVVEKKGPEFVDLSSKFGSYKAESSWKKESENNPLTTQRFGADPGWMVYDGRLYIYTTNDAYEYDGNGKIKDNSYDSGTINCVSTADMVNWTDHGAIPVADKNGRTQNGAAKWAFAAWAPDAAWKMINGKPKFFLYFANSGGGIGVLTADSPIGPWSDPLGHALLTGQSPNCGDVVWMFDPGVYYDEKTDEAYLFFGGGRKDGVPAETPGTGRVVKLGKDMISLDGNPVKMETPYLFEDSSVIKIGDTWYYSYCANWNVPGGCNINGNSFGSADICYMTSKNPLGPWTKSTFSGMVFGNTGAQGIDKGGNNHHSIIYFKNKYYVAYHSRQQALRMDAAHDGKDHNYRSTQINEAYYDAGTGKITCKGDMVGVKQIESLDPYKTVGAETMNNQSKNVQVQGLGDTVVTAKANDWTKVSGVEFKGTNLVRVKAASNNGAVIRMTTGKVDGDVLAYIEIPAGGTMTEIEAGVSQSLSGVKDVYFSFSGDVKFDSWVVE